MGREAKMTDGEVAFPSAENAAEALAEYANSLVFPRAALDAEEIAKAAIDGGWAKSLMRKRAGGSGIYRNWVIEIVPRMIKSARYVINQEQFDLLVRRTGLDLLRVWRGDSLSRYAKISFGAAFRAVDRLFMAINESEACRSDSILGLLHVPLDGSTLRPLRLCNDELVDRDYAIEIPSVVPSGFVVTEEQYTLLQKAISTLAGRAGVPPIVYAYFCASVSPS